MYINSQNTAVFWLFVYMSATDKVYLKHSGDKQTKNYDRTVVLVPLHTSSSGKSLPLEIPDV